MRTHVKSLIIEAKQENPENDFMDGAIKVVALIDTCIQELAKFDINYLQGPKIGRALVHDQVNGESAFVDIKGEKDEDDVRKRVAKKKNKNKYTRSGDNERMSKEELMNTPARTSTHTIVPRNVIVNIDFDDEIPEEVKHAAEFVDPFSSTIDSSGLNCNDDVASKDADEPFINPFEKIYGDSTTPEDR
ncbi:16775_t:CDS:1 [Acaulospora colombiana]|uniref:16775_t:CDS:1 n=1 Tax=Acaulospora colombiana TaxID=27376 RepID=A0ACA9K1T4_9GLOM|nr:16775_t:CDS:1 [Acaulospora colombiana]